MKFLADMGVSPVTVGFLRGLGHEAVHLHEEGLDRLPDTSIKGFFDAKQSPPPHIPTASWATA